MIFETVSPNCGGFFVHSQTHQFCPPYKVILTQYSTLESSSALKASPLVLHPSFWKFAEPSLLFSLRKWRLFFVLATLHLRNSPIPYISHASSQRPRHRAKYSKYSTQDHKTVTTWPFEIRVNMFRRSHIRDVGFPMILLGREREQTQAILLSTLSTRFRSSCSFPTAPTRLILKGYFSTRKTHANVGSQCPESKYDRVLLGGLIHKKLYQSDDL